MSTLQKRLAGLTAPGLSLSRGFDGPLGKVVRNFGTVMSGQAAIAAIGFLALTLNTRALDVAGLGILFLIQATCELISKVLAFQNWQTMIKFGAEAVQERDGGRLRAAWRLGFLLDSVAALAAAVIAAGLFLAAPALIGLDAENARLGLVYAASLVLSGSGVSIGALRLLDAFGVVVAINVAGALALLVNAAVLWTLGAPLWVYLLSIPAITATMSLALIVAGYVRTRRAARDLDAHRAVASALDRRGYLKFALGVSATGTLNALRQRAELLVVGAILGPAAAALYGVAYRAAAMLARFADSGRQSVYPVLGQQVAEGDFRGAASLSFRLCRIGALVAVPAIAVLALAGGDLLRLVFGAGFADAAPNLLLLGAGMAVYAVVFPLGPLIQIAMGSGRFLILSLIAFAGFLVFGALGPWLYGQPGAGAGALAFSLILAGLSFGQIMLRLRREGAP
ncbi:MAG: lipopolysaccharide biosynthesis protein [Sphingomonadales bacterium]